MSSNHVTAFEKSIAQKIKMKSDCSEETAINIAQGILVALKEPEVLELLRQGLNTNR